MRQTILALLFLSALTKLSAQNTNQLIEEKMNVFVNSWNKHDFSDMKNYIAEDCDFVNSFGMHWKGRNSIQYAHQTFHQQFLKNTRMEKRSVTIKMIQPDVAIAHMLWHLSAYTLPDSTKAGNNDNLATIVLVNKEGNWQITAMEHVEVNEKAKPFNPIVVVGYGKQKKSLLVN